MEPRRLGDFDMGSLRELSHDGMAPSTMTWSLRPQVTTASSHLCQLSSPAAYATYLRLWLRMRTLPSDCNPSVDPNMRRMPANNCSSEEVPLATNSGNETHHYVVQMYGPGRLVGLLDANVR